MLNDETIKKKFLVKVKTLAKENKGKIRKDLMQHYEQSIHCGPLDVQLVVSGPVVKTKKVT